MYYVKRLAILLMLCLPLINMGQTGNNLVVDGSFEDATAHTNGSYYWFSLNKWKNPNNLSPDYHSDLDIYVQERPSYRTFGFYQRPMEGKGIAAIIAIQEGYPNTAREYVQGSFSEPLQESKKYEVKFYVSRAEAWPVAVSHIGAYLSTVPITFTYRCELEPQIESNNILSDTLNWMEIKGEYIAKGGEKHITLGNFRDDKQSDTIVTPIIVNVSSQLISYYFIDNVNVICLDCPIDEVGVGIVEQNQNPKNVVFNTSTNTLNVSERGTLVIYNMQGVKVLECLVVSGEELSVGAENLGGASGVYVWQLQTEKDVQRGKFAPSNSP